MTSSLSYQIASDFVYDCQTLCVPQLLHVLSSCFQHKKILNDHTFCRQNESFCPLWLRHGIQVMGSLPFHNGFKVLFLWVLSINLTAFLFSGTFNFGHFPLFTRWCLVVKNRSSFTIIGPIKCEATVGDNVQGITTLVGRRLGKALTIKRKVWDLAMFRSTHKTK